MELFYLIEFIAFLGPILWYERRVKSENNLALTSSSFFWFIFIPNIPNFLLFGSLFILGPGITYEIVIPLFIIPIVIIFTSAWILGREYLRRRNQIEFQSSTKKGMAWCLPMVGFIVLGALMFIYGYIPMQQNVSKAIRAGEEADKKFEQDMKIIAQKSALEDATTAPPNTIFDNAVIKAKQELAAYLGVLETKISTLSYNVKYTGELWVEQALCLERNMKFVPFLNSSSGDKIITNGEVTVVNENTAILSTKPGPLSSISIPIEVKDPLPTSLSFDYRFEGLGNRDINIIFDDKKIEVAGPLLKNGQNGYAKDIFIGDMEVSNISSGKHRLILALDKYGDGNPESVKISSLYIGTTSSKPYPCVAKGSENRRVIFVEGADQYAYMINASGKYFRMGDFR